MHVYSVIQIIINKKQLIKFCFRSIWLKIYLKKVCILVCPQLLCSVIYQLDYFLDKRDVYKRQGDTVIQIRAEAWNGENCLDYKRAAHKHCKPAAGNSNNRYHGIFHGVFSYNGTVFEPLGPCSAYIVLTDRKSTRLNSSH